MKRGTEVIPRIRCALEYREGKHQQVTTIGHHNDTAKKQVTCQKQMRKQDEMLRRRLPRDLK